MATGAAAAQAGQRQQRKNDHQDGDCGPGSVAGNLVADPDLRYTEAGRAVANLRVACSERVQNPKSGQWEDGETIFYDVTCWGNLAETITECMQKGDRLVAEGRWTSRHFEDNDGEMKERVSLTARDAGPSLLFRGARIARPQRQAADPKGGGTATRTRSSASGSKGGR